MNSCLNYTEDCDNATMCPCLNYKCKYTDEELIEKLKASPHINNITYPFVCRCDMDREERFNTDNSNKEFTYPTISFKPLENRDEKSVIEYMNIHPEVSNFMVYLRCKYEHQIEWEYLIEACAPDWNDEILWLIDWHEGQQDVEYLAITQIDFGGN